MAFPRWPATYRQAFGTFFLARLLGLEVSYPEGTCVVTFEPANFLFNPQGTLHGGGVIATVMDISMGHLLEHAGGSGIRPLPSEVVDGEGELVAFATATSKAL